MSTTTPLDQLSIASPCTASWQTMEGDDRVRYCNQCHLHVYNLSAMTTAEATELVQSHEGRLCARFYRRSDGTLLTTDCPVGLMALRRRVARAWATSVAVALFLMANVAGAVGAYRALAWIPGGKKLQRNDNAWQPSQARNALRPMFGLSKEEPMVVLGEICLPPLPTPTPPASQTTTTAAP